MKKFLIALILSCPLFANAATVYYGFVPEGVSALPNVISLNRNDTESFVGTYTFSNRGRGIPELAWPISLGKANSFTIDGFSYNFDMKEMDIDGVDCYVYYLSNWTTGKKLTVVVQ